MVTVLHPTLIWLYSIYAAPSCVWFTKRNRWQTQRSTQVIHNDANEANEKKKNGSDLLNPFSALVRSTSLAACQKQPWVRLQSVWTVLTANPFTYKTVRIHAANPPILLFFCLPSLQAPFHPMLCKLPDIHSTHRDVTAPWGWKILYLLSVSCTFMSVVIDLFCSLSIVRKPLGYCCMIGSWGRIGNMWPI